MIEHVILVDSDDKEIGSMEKMEAHLSGMLHRAFSVFIFNSKGELLLQQRASGKYHSSGKWTNTCCSHPRKNEPTLDAAQRRLKEEMGMDCDLKYGFSFIYQADLDKGLSENEYDHVYFGISDEIPVPDPEEVSSFNYMNMNDLRSAIESSPSAYTEWLKICFDRMEEEYKKLFES